MRPLPPMLRWLLWEQDREGLAFELLCLLLLLFVVLVPPSGLGDPMWLTP